MSEKRSALIVATSEYADHRLTALEGPGHDAEALHTVLENAEIGGFDVQVALNSHVDALRRTLESFFANRARDDLLLVHFSGHGLKDDDGQLYLAAADTEIDRLLSTGVDAAWVNRLMHKCRSEKIALFLDCCFAGAFTAGMARRAGVDTAGVKEQFTGSGVFVITASDAMQYSFEGGQQVGQPPEPSPFTRALVDGLKTGEADRNEDGVVSINELFDFLEDRIRETSPSQTPTKSAFNQVGDWAIARSTRLPSVRLLPEDLQKALKSEDALDRFGALIYLRDLIEAADVRVAAAAMQAVQRLAQDDSRRVAAAAQRLATRESAGIGATTDAGAEPSPVIEEPEASGPETTANIQDAAPITPEVAQIPRAVAANADVALPSVQPEAASQAPVQAPPVQAAPQAPAASTTPAFVAPPAPAVTTPAPQPPPPTAWGQPKGASAPLWGPSPAVSSRPKSREDQYVGVPWSFGRAAGRGALGIGLWATFSFIWSIGKESWLLTDSSSLEAAFYGFIGLGVVLATFIAILVALVEKLVPALRIPGGKAYRVVGNNRWTVAAILGVAIGLLIGAFSDGYLINTQGWTPGMDGLIISAALGFIAAEAVVGKSSRGQLDKGSQAT